MDHNWINSEQDALIYIGDPMCSWCYGIAPELDQLKTTNPDLDFRLIMGGLRPYNTEKALEMADFLKSHWLEIAERTGLPFSTSILDDPDFIYDTEPPCRAVIVARSMNPEIELDFFKAIQTAFYAKNENTNLITMYLQLAFEFNLDQIEFKRRFESDEFKNFVKNDFQLTQDMGIRGFPSIVVKMNGNFTYVANGYDTAENINQRIQNLR